MANSQNDVDARESLARESLRVATASDDTEAMALSLAWLSIPLAMSGNLTEAVELAESSLSLARSLAELAEPSGGDGSPLQHPADGRPGRTGDRTRRGGRRDQPRSGANCGHAATCWWRPRKSTGDGATGSSPRSRHERALRSKHAIDDRSGLQLLLETLAWMAAEGGAASACRDAPRLGRARPQGHRYRGPRRPAASNMSVRSPLHSKASAQGPMTGRTGAASR